MNLNVYRPYLIRAGILLFWLLIIGGSLFLSFVHPFSRKTINVFTWGDIFDPLYIAKFEKETGIGVNISYYTTNEELLAKLKETRGHGYDLIVPSDYSVAILRSVGLLKKLDKNRLPFNRINPALLGHNFDKNNDYSIPFEWELFGLGVDTNNFTTPVTPSWRLLFKPEGYKVAMVNDPIEAIALSSFYLYNSLEKASPEKIKEITKLLLEQKKSVEAYSDFRADYFLATKSCPLIVASSSYIWRCMRDYPYVDFWVPQEGTFITIENLAIPQASTKDDLIYQFIEFLYRPETAEHHFNQFAFIPAVHDTISQLNLTPSQKNIIDAGPEKIASYLFFKPIMDEQAQHDLWVSVKS